MKCVRFGLIAGLICALFGGAFAPGAEGAEGPLEGKNAVGKQVQEFSLQDYRGKLWRLSDFGDRQIVVVLFLGTECPIVRLYAPRLKEIQSKYNDRGLQFVGVYSNQQDSLAEISHFARVNQIEFPLLKDPGNTVADSFEAARTPEVFVLDRERRVRYQGRIDDQYTYGVQRPKVKHEYLTEAVDSLLEHREVVTSHAEAVGCLIGRVFKEQRDSDVTYSKQISRLLQAHCIECHREGEIAPFSLTDYEEVVGWAEMILEVVQDGRMPPWHANPEHGQFSNDARLSNEEKEMLRQWVNSGAPEGDPADLPPPRQFVQGWRIGKPDQVIQMADKPFHVPAEGEVKYQYFVVDPGFTEDKWIRAAECRPGNRAVVHHIIVAAIPPGGRGDRSHDNLESAWLTATAPGAMPLILPDGFAKRVPAGSRLVFQMHYTPNGVAQDDLSSVGLVFADPKTVKREVITQSAANSRFRIPAGANNHRVDSKYTITKDSLMLAMFPHMHLRGKAFRYTAQYPDGQSEVLLDIPRYDFNWQNSYVFPEPKRLPKGTEIHCVAHFDNSEENLANPDPTKDVTWGDQTWEEMMIGYFDLTTVEEIVPESTSAVRRTDTFLKSVRQSKELLNEDVRQEAKTAFQSDENFQRFAVKLREILPQLDRVCLTVVRDEKLKVERAAQEKQFRRLVGGAGAEIPAQGLALASYVDHDRPVVVQDLSKVSNPDMRFMRTAFSASLHIPFKSHVSPATLNFWSTERDAFPEEAVKVLADVAAILADVPSNQTAR